MKVTFLCLSLICLATPALLTGCSSNKPAEPPAAKANLLETLNGTWVSEKYLSAIKASKTPFVDHLESLTIYAADKKITWTNFHEAYDQHVSDSGKENNLLFVSVGAPESTEPNYKKVHFSQLDNAIIFLEPGVAQQTNTRFIKIDEPLPQYANKLLLAGKYKDSEGNVYEFTPEGKASWPTMNFTYRFILDPIEANCPYIETSVRNGAGEPVRFGYKWVGAQLFFFDITNEDAPISCSKLPIFSLSKL